MSIDKKPEDQITEAGAVELDEAQLDDAAGGLLPAVSPTALKIRTTELKISTGDIIADGSVRAADGSV